MIELIEHPAYKLIETYGNSMVVDFVILKNFDGIHDIDVHKEAAMEAIKIIADRCNKYADDKMKNEPRCKHMKRKDFSSIQWHRAKMDAEKYPVEQFFAIPKDEYYVDKLKVKNPLLNCKNFEEYAYAFLEPPYSNEFVISDWQKLNSLLFSSKENLEIYKWNTEWSNYFNDGLEWWGAYFWTVYDSKLDTFTVIGASTTD